MMAVWLEVVLVVEAVAVFATAIETATSKIIFDNFISFSLQFGALTTNLALRSAQPFSDYNIA